MKKGSRTLADLRTSSEQDQPETEVPRDFQRLQKKIVERQRKRNYQGQGNNLSVPSSLDTLLLKYGPAPLSTRNNSSLRTSQRLNEEMPSYKKDAMKLIINRIYRQIGNVFEELQRKVMQDDIMRLRRKALDLLGKEDRQYPLKRQLDYGSDSKNLQEIGPVSTDEFPSSKSQFRQAYEMKKKKAKDGKNLKQTEYPNIQNLVYQSVETEESHNSPQRKIRSLGNNQAKEYVLQDDSSLDDIIQIEDAKHAESNMGIKQVVPMKKHLNRNVLSRQKGPLRQHRELEKMEDASNTQQTDGIEPSQNKNNRYQYSSEEEKRQAEDQEPNGKLKNSHSLDAKKEADEKDQDQTAHLDLSDQREALYEQSRSISSIPYSLESAEAEQEVIIQPAKKVTSYLSRDIQGRVSKQQNQSTRQLADVEMSFNENPFIRRISSQAIAGQSQSTIQSQCSPDFKEKAPQNHKRQSSKLFSFAQQQESSGELEVLRVQNQQDMNQLPLETTGFKEDKQQVELSHLQQQERDKQESKPKFTDKLKQLMSELAHDKQSYQLGESKQSAEGSQANLEEGIDTTQSNKESIVTEQEAKDKSKQITKINELRKRIDGELDKNQPSKQSYESPYSKKGALQHTDSPLGKMYKIASKEVLFEESKRDQHQVPSISSQTSLASPTQVIKIQSKRSQAQKSSQFRQSDLHASTSQQFEEKVQTKPCNPQQQHAFEKLAIYIQAGIHQSTSRAFLSVLEHSLHKFKGELLVKILQKNKLKKAFTEIIRHSKKKRGQAIIRYRLEKLLQVVERKLDRSFWQWKVYTSQQRDQAVLMQRHKMSTTLHTLCIAIKHKQVSIVKSSFDELKKHQQAQEKQSVDYSRRQAAQMMFSVQKKKELIQLNRQFQKYRKAVFLEGFKNKILRLARLLNDKIFETEKEGFKGIVNYCLRNDQYKQKIEKLNREFNDQRAKLMTQSLSRTFKVAKRFLQCYGHRKLCSYYLQERMTQAQLKKMTTYLSNYQTQNEINTVSKYLKKWQRVAQQQKDEEVLQRQSCKKIKLIFGMRRKQSLQSRFEQWKAYTAHFINIENSRVNLERQIQRNTVLEQTIKDLWWNALTKGFQVIKQTSEIKKQLELLIKKNQSKCLKGRRAWAFNNWKERVYKAKLIKVNLQIVLKGVEKRREKAIGTYFKRWKSQHELVSSQKDKMFDLLQKKLQKQTIRDEQILRQAFKQWQRQQLSFRQLKQKMCAALRLKERQTQQYCFLIWKNYYEGCQQRATKVLHMFVRIQKRWGMNKLAENMERKEFQVKGVQLIFSRLQAGLSAKLEDAFYMIKQQQIHLQLRQTRLQKGVRLVKRLKKAANLKDLQKAVIQWKLSSIGQTAQQERHKMMRQYQRRILQTIVNKSKHRSAYWGFQAFKRNLTNSKALLHERQSKQKALHSLFGNLQQAVQSQIKASFSHLHAAGIQGAENNKVKAAISKLSATTKICEIINNQRRDRVLFQRWKNESMKSQSVELASAILSNIVFRHTQQSFYSLKDQSHKYMIYKTRQMIGKNSLKALIYKLYKEKTQRAFTVWLINSSRSKQGLKVAASNLPPKHSSAIESHSQQPASIMSKILRRPSRANSANNSYNGSSGGNMRYSNKGYEDSSDDEMLGDDKTVFSSSSPRTQQEIMPTQKHQSQHSCHGKATSDQNSPQFQASIQDDNKNWPSTQRNQDSKPMWKLTGADNQHTSPLTDDDHGHKKEEIKKSNLHLNALNKSPKKNSNKPSSSISQGSKKQGLPLKKYLSNESQSSRSSTSNSKNNGQPEHVQASKDTCETKKSVEEQSVEEYGSQEDSPTSHDEGNDGAPQFRNESQIEIQGKSVSKLFSPMSQTSLEPVPEEPLPKKKSMKGKSKKKAKPAASLSSFLNFGKQHPKQPMSKEEVKVNKKRSIENNEKFKVFLKKPKGQSSAASSSPLQKQDNKSQMSSNSKNEGEHDDSCENTLISKIVPLQVREPVQRGLIRLERFVSKKVYRSVLGDVIQTIFSEDFEDIYQQRLKVRQINKLRKIMNIRKDVSKRKRFMLWEAFALWKRLDYISMITHLQKYRSTLEELYVGGKRK